MNRRKCLWQKKRQVLISTGHSKRAMCNYSCFTIYAIFIIITIFVLSLVSRIRSWCNVDTTLYPEVNFVHGYACKRRVKPTTVPRYVDITSFLLTACVRGPPPVYETRDPTPLPSRFFYVFLLFFTRSEAKTIATDRRKQRVLITIHAETRRRRVHPERTMHNSNNDNNIIVCGR